MQAFQMSNLPEIIFGEGKLDNLPGIISAKGSKRLLIIHGAGSFMKSNHANQLINRLEQNGISFQLESICSEPSPAMIDNIVANQRGAMPDLVVSIGGGSVLDAGKAISAMFKEKGSVRDYLEGVGNKAPSGVKVPFIAVPTTSGTGSETTKNAVISEIGENGFKKSLRHDNYIPDYAIVDPVLSASCPPSLTAACGMDTLTQLIESYLSSKSSPFTDSLVLPAIKLVFENLEKAFHDGSNLEARAKMAYASMISGIGLANAGLGLVHGFASPLGAALEIPHGVVCGTLIESANRANIKRMIASGQKVEAYRKYIELGKMLTNDSSLGDEYYFQSLTDKLQSLIKELELPRLSEYGLTRDQVPGIVAKTGLKNNPVQLSSEEIEEVLLSRL